MQKAYDLAIIITGTNISLSLEPIVEFFYTKINNTVSIGDGTIELNGVDGVLSLELNKIKTTYNNFQDKKILLFLNMHGTNLQNGQHAVQVDNDDVLLKTSGLFSFINKTINKPIDIIFTACHGKSALADINHLPNGSNIIIFSDEDDYTYANTYIYSLEAMSGMSNFTLDKFFSNYLAYLTVKQNPIIATVGGEIINPLLRANSIIGKPILETSRLYVHKNFGSSICEDDYLCHNKLDALMNKIEKSSSIDDFYQPNSYFTKELAQNLSEIFKKYEKLEEDEENADLCIPPFIEYLENLKENPECSYFFAIIKNDIDLLLHNFNISATLNLESNFIQKIIEQEDNHEDENDIDSDNIFETYKNLSNRAIYDIFKLTNAEVSYDFLKFNDDFKIPEYPEYGTVLGIANDLYTLSLLNNSNIFV